MTDGFQHGWLPAWMASSGNPCAHKLRPLALGGLACVAALVALGAPASASVGSCPNEALRTGYSAYLPDCRAYELVTEPGIEPYFETAGTNENLVDAGNRALGSVWGEQPSVSGEKIAFFSMTPPAASDTDGPYFLAARGPSGWRTKSLIPPQSAASTLACFPSMLGFTPDLSRGVLSDGRGQPGFLLPGEAPTTSCGHDEPRLVSGEPPNYQNVFVQGSEGASYELVNVAEVPGEESNAWFQAASADLTHVVFTEEAKLTPEAPVGEDVYEWAGGKVRLVTVLPNGTAVAGALANAYLPYGVESGPGAASFTRAVSLTGANVVFEAEGRLYSRQNADQPQSAMGSGGECVEADKACTVQLDASQAGGSGGGGRFMWANADGSRVFFTDMAPETQGEPGLTSSTVAGSGGNLYECHIESGPRCDLTDLTATSDARVAGVSGVNTAGSRAYFVAEGALPGSGQNGEGAHAEAGQPNLYVAALGTAPKFIAVLAPYTDHLAWVSPRELTSRMSADGTFFAFNSVEPLTGYNNHDAATGEPDQEIFLFDAETGVLNCASCNPNGKQPTAPTRLHAPIETFLFVHAPGRLQRNVTEDGRVFFDTPNALLPSADNGFSNVYEFSHGAPRLISTGTSDSSSYFFDSSASGGDVFLVTSQQLVGRDGDEINSLYDAREGGGFTEPGVPVSCSGEACRGFSSGLPLPPTAASASFSGPGNLGALASRGASAKVTILGTTAHGSIVAVRVRVPVKGRISISGSGIRIAVRSAAAAGTYGMKVTLTAAGRRALKHRHRLRLRLHVKFTPDGGQPSTATALVTVKA